MSEIKQINEEKSLPKPAVYNMVKSGAFKLYIMPEEEMNNMDIIPHWISLPTYKTNTRAMDDFNLIIDGELIRKTTYFGKPTKITNSLTWEEIVQFVDDYNQQNVECLTIREFTEDGLLTLETKYFNPQITSVSMGNHMKDGTENKTLMFNFSFSDFINNHPK